MEQLTAYDVSYIEDIENFTSLPPTLRHYTENVLPCEDYHVACTLDHALYGQYDDGQLEFTDVDLIGFVCVGDADSDRDWESVIDDRGTICAVDDCFTLAQWREFVSLARVRLAERQAAEREGEAY